MSKTYYNLLFLKQYLDTTVFQQELHIFFGFFKKGVRILKRSNYAYIYIKPNFIYQSEL